MPSSITMRFSQPVMTIDIQMGHDLLNKAMLIPLCKKYGNQIVILTDSFLKQLYGNRLSQELDAQIIEIPSGEKAKTREVKQRIEDQMLHAGFRRDTVVIALGGGSVTDLAGFIASTYFRGIALILIPTTIIGMVDAAVGGKTAVDTSLGKNLIGTFYYPKVIINDLDLLKTLSAKGIMNGLAEIIKMGCIFDAEILTLSQDEYSFEAMMLKAIEAKIAVITQDPFDKGLRQILNFGHTIGHALEALSDFELCHGEAVAIGCITESYLSFQSGYLSKEDFLKIERIYKTHFKDIQLPKNYQRNALLQCMEFDKKKSKEGIRFVLIDTIGHALARKGQFCHPVKLGDLETALSYMEQHCGRF